jgi:hypothetical protein
MLLAFCNRAEEHDHAGSSECDPASHRRVPWNKGKLTGAKPPLRPKHVWSIRTKLQIEGRARDLAMFNLAIDSKLRSATGGLDGVRRLRPGDRLGRPLPSHGQRKIVPAPKDANLLSIEAAFFAGRRSQGGSA